MIMVNLKVLSHKLLLSIKKLFLTIYKYPHLNLKETYLGTYLIKKPLVNTNGYNLISFGEF